MSNPRLYINDCGTLLLASEQDICIKDYFSVQRIVPSNQVKSEFYPGMNEEVKTALIRSSLESNWSTRTPLGLHIISVTATAITPPKQSSIRILPLDYLGTRSIAGNVQLVILT